jgi:ferrous iron transport protein B
MNKIKPTVVIIGKESTGKSQLVASITKQHPYISNFRGATVECESYQDNDFIFVDTPGVLHQSDTITTVNAVNQLQQCDVVLLVVQATHIDDDFSDLLPLIKGKKGIVVITFWDKIQQNGNALKVLNNLKLSYNLNIFAVDTRKISNNDRQQILNALKQPKTFLYEEIQFQCNWRIEPPKSLIEYPYIGPLIAVFLLLTPAILAVWLANSFATIIDPLISGSTTSLVNKLIILPSPLKEIFVGRYGIMVMGPLLFVWSIPTVILYALFIGCYKASGIMDRITVAMHPLMRHIGLNGRDLVRIIMGFGCNVPAVVNTRACSACSRNTCVSAIAFGSACSYQFAASLGVFAAARKPFLVVPYLFILTFTTLIYTRIVSSPQSRSSLNILVIEHRTFLEVPRLKKIWYESRITIVQFFQKAIPIFFLITIIASIVDWVGLVNLFASIISPLTSLFHLPKDVALPIILASIRKDGILLLAEQNIVFTLTSGQILLAVYLSGILLPCLVTAITIAKEITVFFAIKLLVKQAVAACVFSLILAWVIAIFHL